MDVQKSAQWERMIDSDVRRSGLFSRYAVRKEMKDWRSVAVSFLTHGQGKYGEPPQKLGSETDSGTNGCKRARQHDGSGKIPIAIVMCEYRSVHERL